MTPQDKPLFDYSDFQGELCRPYAMHPNQTAGSRLLADNLAAIAENKFSAWVKEHYETTLHFTPTELARRDQGYRNRIAALESFLRHAIQVVHQAHHDGLPCECQKSICLDARAALGKEGE